MESFPFPTDLSAFIVWLGSAAGIAFIQSTLLEKLPGWPTLPERFKSIAVFLIAFSLPALSAWLMGIARPEHLSLVQWLLNLALQGLMVWASSQWIHAKNPARVKVEVTETVTQTIGTAKTGLVETKVETSGEGKAVNVSPPTD